MSSHGHQRLALGAGMPMKRRVLDLFSFVREIPSLCVEASAWPKVGPEQRQGGLRHDEVSHVREADRAGPVPTVCARWACK